MKQYYVYILASRTRRLYVGVTNDLVRRVREHKKGTGSVFTRKYRINRLVYFAETTSIYSAISRERQIKGWSREKKLALINRSNPAWQDLSDGWFEE